MKATVTDRSEIKNVVASPTERSAKSAQEREVIIADLRKLDSGPEGGVVHYLPDNDKETTRGMKMRVSRAANSAGLTDVRTGVHKDGGILVWREAKAPRKPRGNGKAETPAPQPAAAGGSR